MATDRQKEIAANKLMRAIHTIEAAQNSKEVRACNIDQSRINEAKDRIYDQVKNIENSS